MLKTMFPVHMGLEKKMTCFVRAVQALSSTIFQQRLLNRYPSDWIYSAYGKLIFSSYFFPRVLLPSLFFIFFMFNSGKV